MTPRGGDAGASGDMVSAAERSSFTKVTRARHDVCCSGRGAMGGSLAPNLMQPTNPGHGHTRTNSSHINCHRYVLSEVETLACPQCNQDSAIHTSSRLKVGACHALCLGPEAARASRDKKTRLETRPSIASSPLWLTCPKRQHQPRTARAWAAGTLSSPPLLISRDS